MNTPNFFLNNGLAQTTPYNMGIEVSYAEGIYIYDTTGKRYADLIAGLAVSALGHGNESIKKALHEQIEKYLHVMVYGEFLQQPQLQLAQLLQSVLPPQLNTCYFVNSGTEANEAALKLTKRVTGRKRLISFEGAYHGSTHGSLSVSGNEKKKTAYRPLLPQVDFIALNDFEALQQIDETVAGVILETIQADAGIRIPTKAYLKALRDRCTKMGTLLILDEIQAGYGRTGTLWAFEQYGIVPDILTLGKALGGGLPMGAFISSKSNMEKLTFDPMLGHITTFGGHPLPCTAAYAGLKFLLDKNLVETVAAKGQLLHDLLIEHTLVKEIRYRGLFFAIEMANAAVVQQVVKGCLERGLITFWFLSCPSAFRLAPPLTITEMEIRTFSAMILEVMNQIIDTD